METGFKKYHPISNILYFVSMLVFALLFKHPATVTTCFFSTMIYYIILCRKNAVKTIVFFILPMILFVVFFNALFSHYGITPLYTLKNGNNITLESIIYGLILGIITVSIIMLFFCYNEVVTTDKFLHLFGKILPSFALVISMTLRFIPLFKTRLNVIHQVQQNFRKSNGNIIEKIKYASKSVSILITWSLEKAIETSNSMKSRGYGLKKRKNYSKYRLKTDDVVLIIIILILDSLMLIGYINKTLYCFYNPYISISSNSTTGLITIISFVLLCFLPIIIDVKEVIKWLRLKSKI